MGGGREVTLSFLGLHSQLSRSSTAPEEEKFLTLCKLISRTCTVFQWKGTGVEVSIIECIICSYQFFEKTEQVVFGLWYGFPVPFGVIGWCQRGFVLLLVLFWLCYARLVPSCKQKPFWY